MGKIKGGVETITLCGSHAIILRNTPDIILDNPSKLGGCYKDQEVKKFGLFGPEINYNTFYPDATPDMFTPKDEDFIEPTYRLLSEVIVHKGWNPIDFSMNGVLKSSMPLLLGQTVNCDHEGGIGNAIGAVSKVFWQDSYKMGGVTIPSGINGVLKIDAKSNPKIARGIQMDPPSIHSNSVSVNFKWEQSHPNMDRDDFWGKLGTYDKDGQLVRKIVTEIMAYYHTSLVDHGADPFAQLVNGKNQIINPVFASANNLSKFSKKEIEEAKKSTNSVFIMSYKSTEDLSYKTSVTNTYNDNEEDSNNNSNNKENPDEMEKLLEFLSKLPKAADGKDWTEESLTAAIENSKKTETAEQLVKDLGLEIQSLKDKVKVFEDKETEALTSLREKTKSTYMLAMGFTEEGHSDAITGVIAEGDEKVNNALLSQYQAIVDKNMPVTCKSCGSTDCSRASANTEGGGSGKGTGGPVSNSEALDKARKSRKEDSDIK